jgi:alanyl aminopeptidase
MSLALGVLAALALPMGEAASPPALRLPGTVRPVRQAIELTIDPSLEAFSGSVAIELDVRKPTSVLWLNATGLEVTSASLGGSGEMRPAETT